MLSSFVVPSRMSLKPGQKLGRYEIASLLGAGGMGEVYLAKDPKIGREVAIKVLPASISDESRLARFEQEAMAAGSLNHPNVLAIYDVDSEEGVTYVVSEFVKGETLRDVMGSQPLPLKKAINYTLQAASGLAAAHEKGIIHRDIKPENMMVTSDGRLKILDFGLAKLTEASPQEAGTDIPTRKINTDAGTVMGTVGYMSPEQLRGHAVDARSDIFSLGVVIYEMLSGRKAFAKDSTADTISAILREDPPDLSDTNKQVNPGLERIVRRCLEKNREERFHSAKDLAFAIEALSTASSDGFRAVSGEVTTERNSSTWSWLPWAFVSLLLLALLGGGWMYLRRPVVQPEPVRFTVAAPPDTTLGESVAISPDGKRIAFTASGQSGDANLYIRPIDSIEAVKLPGTDGARFPFWSPDSRSIAFFAGSKLKRTDISGSPPQSIADTNLEPRGGAWGPDGTIVFAPQTIGGLMKVPANGGAVTPVTELDTAGSETSHRWPSFLPDGKHFLYFARGNDRDKQGVMIASIESSDKKMLFTSRVGATYVPAEKGGYLLFVREGGLIAQRFDLNGLTLMGEPVTLAPSVQSYPTEVGPTGSNVVSASNSGTLVFRSGSTAITELAWFDRAGKASPPLAPKGIYHEPLFSPDSKRVVVSLEGNDRNQDVWLMDLGRNVLSRLTFDPSVDSSATWSPDGSTIYFSSNRNAGRFSIYKKPSSGIGAEEMVYSADVDAFPDSISPDGRYMLVDHGGGPGISPAVFLLDLTTGRSLPALGATGAVQHAAFSPDGKWISYSSGESGRSEVYVQPFPATGGRWQISTAGGDQAMWAGNGQEMFFIGLDRKLFSVPVKAGSTFEVGPPELLFQTRVPASGLTDERNNYAPSLDGKQFLLSSLAESATDAPLTVVLNWESSLPK